MKKYVVLNLLLLVSLFLETSCNMKVASNDESDSDDVIQASVNDETTQSDCQILEDGRFLVNGEKCSRSDYNYEAIAAVLFYPSEAETAPDKELLAVCTGSLISSKHILTAAHCLKNYTFNPNRILIEINGEFLEVESTIAHPDHTTVNPNHDIAILSLKKPVSNTPFSFYTYTTRVSLGEEIKVLGFGVESANSSYLDGVVKVAAMKVSRVTDYWFASELSESGTGACSGDSGGPALVVYGNFVRIVGVVSIGSNNCDKDTRYTMISSEKNLNFILDAID